MKTSIYSVFVCCLVAFAFSCSESSNIGSVIEKSKFIEQGKELAAIHNECLANIYVDLATLKTRAAISSEEKLKDAIISSVNRTIINCYPETRSSGEIPEIKMSDLDITIDEIKSGLSEKERYYVEAAISLNGSSSVENLLIRVDSDKELSNNRKQAVICFITTFEASTEYWDKHMNEWLELFDKVQTRASLKQVALADAWWGFQGMLMSGMNPIAGGGMAAVASAGTAIWGR